MSPTDIMNLALMDRLWRVALAQIMAMIRLVIGPGTGDRILALDTMVVNAIGLDRAAGHRAGDGDLF